MLIRLFVLAGLSLFVLNGTARADDPAPMPEWRTDPDSCRAMTEALLRNRITDATDAVVPANATDRLRRNIRALMHRLADGLASASGGRPAEMQRVMPDAMLNGKKIAMESWSFGDELYVVGCMISPSGQSAHISIQAYPTIKDVLDHLDDGREGATMQ